MDIVGVRFKKNYKIYYFDPVNETVNIGDDVIVETIKGIELGKIVIKKNTDEIDLKTEIKPIIRIATEEDKLQSLDNRNKVREAIIVFKEKIKEFNLDMQLVDADYTFDKAKLTFYFLSDERIDFRELVRDLASKYKTRIELRQIGIRDKAKVTGGLGCCGRVCCCNSFLSEFAPVSINMAKNQGASLNPSKILGVCDRLMCCLKYEKDCYDCINKKMPKIGEIIETPKGKATVVSLYSIQETIKVSFDKDHKGNFEIYNFENIKRTYKLDENFEFDKNNDNTLKNI